MWYSDKSPEIQTCILPKGNISEASTYITSKAGQILSPMHPTMPSLRLDYQTLSPPHYDSHHTQLHLCRTGAKGGMMRIINNLLLLYDKREIHDVGHSVRQPWKTKLKCKKLRDLKSLSYPLPRCHPPFSSLTVCPVTKHTESGFWTCWTYHT